MTIKAYCEVCGEAHEAGVCAVYRMFPPKKVTVSEHTRDYLVLLDRRRCEEIATGGKYPFDKQSAQAYTE